MFSVCDLNLWIRVNARVVVAPFARRHLWDICAAASVRSQCVVTRFARRHLWGICAAVLSVGSQCVVRLASLVAASYIIGHSMETSTELHGAP